MNRDERKFLGLMGVIVFALFVPVLLLGAEPPRKPMLTIALDDNWQSATLRCELCRDWARPNPKLRLTDKQIQDVAKRAFKLNATRAQICHKFDLVFVTRDDVPLGYRETFPMIRVGRGRWESIDKRAFVVESRPLQTVRWYTERFVALDRDSKQDSGEDWQPCGFTKSFSWADGYSGAVKVETLPPWEVEKPKMIRGAIVAEPVPEDE